MAAGTMSTDPVAAVYEAYEVLRATGALTPAATTAATQAYTRLLNVSDERAKKLVADFLPEFFRHFPGLADKALNAQLDLCEDADGSVRLRAIRGLLKICEGSPAHVGHIADVLGQLLLVDDEQEIAAVRASLAGLFAVDFSAALKPLLEQIKRKKCDDPALRAKGIDFYKEHVDRLIRIDDINDEDKTERIIILAQELIDLLEAQSQLPSESRLSEEDLSALISPLQNSTAMLNSSQIHSAFVQAVWKALVPDLPTSGNLTNSQVAPFVSAIHTCAKFSSNQVGDLEVEPLFTKFLPIIDQFGATEQMSLLKILIPLAKKCDPPVCQKFLPMVYAAFEALAPLKADPARPLNFAALECVLFAFLTMANQSPNLKHVCGVFVSTGQPSDFKEGVLLKKERFLARLGTVAGAVKHHAPRVKQVIGALRTDLSKLKKAAKTPKDAPPPSNDDRAARSAQIYETSEKLAIAQLARRAITNVDRMVDQLMKKEPELAVPADVFLSYASVPKANEKSPGQDAPTPGSGNDSKAGKKRKKKNASNSKRQTSKTSPTQQQQKQLQPGKKNSGKESLAKTAKGNEQDSKQAKQNLPQQKKKNNRRKRKQSNPSRVAADPHNAGTKKQRTDSTTLPARRVVRRE